MYVAIQRGGTGGLDPSPLDNHKAEGFLSNTSTDPLEKHGIACLMYHHKFAEILWMF